MNSPKEEPKQWLFFNCGGLVKSGKCPGKKKIKKFVKKC